MPDHTQDAVAEARAFVFTVVNDEERYTPLAAALDAFEAAVRADERRRCREAAYDYAWMPESDDYSHTYMSGVRNCLAAIDALGEG